METPSAAALVFGNNAHHVDHLVPLCDLLSIPLILTEEELVEEAGKYYPFIQTHLFRYTDNPEELIRAFDIIFCSTPRPLFDEIFFFAQHFLQKRTHTIWCPHGNSDKGHSSYFMEGLKDEEVALVYGKKMIDFLIEKGVFHQLKRAIIMGNLRYQHYVLHKEHYQTLLDQEIASKLPKSGRTLLYAPTWQDAEKNSSFFEAAVPLIENLPDYCNLIIKLHPNLTLQEGLRIETLIETYQDKANLLIVKRLYTMMPLLDYVDIYIGDMSSIGYDFLSFNKPLFFLNSKKRDPSDPSLFLSQTGTVINPHQFDSIYDIIESALSQDTVKFSNARKTVYDYTFGKSRNLNDLKKEILDSYPLFADRDLPLL